MRRRGGFTILELLISSALLTVLLVTTWGSYITARRSMERTMGRFDLFIKIISFRRGFIHAIQGVTPYPQIANPKADFKGESSKLSFTTLSAPWPVATSGPVSHVQWVEFAKTPAGKHAIGVHPYFFLSDRDKEKTEKKLFEEIKSWEFGYYDGSTWSTAWDYSLKRKLPQQVRVKYTIAGDKREIEDVITVTIAQEGDPARMQGANPFAGQAPPPPPGGAPPPPTQGTPGLSVPPAQSQASPSLPAGYEMRGTP